MNLLAISYEHHELQLKDQVIAKLTLLHGMFDVDINNELGKPIEIHIKESNDHAKARIGRPFYTE